MVPGDAPADRLCLRNDYAAKRSPRPSGRGGSCRRPGWCHLSSTSILLCRARLDMRRPRGCDPLGRLATFTSCVRSSASRQAPSAPRRRPSRCLPVSTPRPGQRSWRQVTGSPSTRITCLRVITVLAAGVQVDGGALTADANRASSVMARRRRQQWSVARELALAKPSIGCC